MTAEGAREPDSREPDPHNQEVRESQVPGQGPAADTAAAAGWRQVVADEFSLKEAVGGVRGAIEALLPGILFVAVYSFTFDLRLTLLITAGVAIAMVLVRLIQRSSTTQAFSGLLGVGIGVIWAWRTGEPEDYFQFGLWTNAANAAMILLSIAVRWPLVGVVVEFFRGRGTRWRTEAAFAGLRRRYYWATGVWASLFVLRLAIQLPLYFSGNVTALGTARLIMGLPLTALALWVIWMLVREVHPDDPDDPAYDVVHDDGEAGAPHESESAPRE